MELSGMSAEALEALAKKAIDLAADLRGTEPSYALALANGVRDKSYNTVRHGWVSSYAGEAEIVMADGRKWKAVGYEPRGSAEWVSRYGWIEFIPVA